VTGATGLVGKALIETILRTLPEVRRLYLLLRPRRDAAGRP
jgi:thioester reductase-like protein